jgi:hypothetical protein
LSLAVSLFIVAPAAAADVTKNQCVDANGRAQHLRTEGKLAQAREDLRLCSDPKCPPIVRSDCTKRLDDLESAQPTIAFGAKDASGNDIVAVRVTVDGKPLLSRLDGTAVPVDPGEHTFVFEAEGQPAVTRRLVVTEGEKGRRESVVVGSPPSPPPPTPPPAPRPSTPPSPLLESPPRPVSPPPASAAGMGTQKVVGLAIGGAGVAGLALGGVFGLLTLSAKNQQISECGGPCSASSHAQAVTDHSTGMTDGVISTVGFIAGGALLVGGALLFFTAHPSSERAAARIVVAPSVGLDGGGVLVRGEL